MSKISKHTEEQKQKALAMAEAATIREASEETGVPAGTIKYWRSLERKERLGDDPNQQNQPNQPTKKIKEISEEATERAKKEIADHIAEKGKKLAEALLETAEEARQELLKSIQQGKTDEEYNSNWVKAVTGAMNYCIKTKNELMGEGDSRENRGGVNVNVSNQNQVSTGLQIEVHPSREEAEDNGQTKMENALKTVRSLGQRSPLQNDNGGAPRR